MLKLRVVLVLLAVLVIASCDEENGNLASEVATLTAQVQALTQALNGFAASSQEQWRQQNHLINLLASIAPVAAPLPVFGNWAISADFANAMMRHVLRAHPKIIVEFGSGLSTLLNAYACKRFAHGCQIHTFDHDAAYAEQTRNSLALHGLSEYATVHYVPLVQLNFQSSLTDAAIIRWYDSDAVGKILSSVGAKIDLVIVDGPPAATQSLNRFLGLYATQQHIAENGVVMLDDARRDVVLVREWMSVTEICCYDIELNVRDFEKGMAVLTRRADLSANKVTVIE
eukprot:TRINITY_DN15279_c0_g1_i1.p1 TRINITY_DN15279_c0_g1~~TRINITY_DN15279_c0_g1_i1.p1  ORF type:complete len:285 (-),score=53.03 TRINITY_DN15279_c0_g1_i1:13-867(-)